MEYLNEEGLAALWDDTKEYVEKYHGEHSGGQDSDGTDAGPIVELTANGHAEQATTTGKNLLGIGGKVGSTAGGPWASSATKDGATLSINGEYVTISGTTTAQADFYIRLVTSMTLTRDIDYVISLDGSVTSGEISIFGYDGRNFSGLLYNAISTRMSSKIVENSDFAITHIMIRAFNAQTFDMRFRVQLELGSTATSYEPYTGGAPSPSPDYPQEIQVARGRNLIDRLVHGVSVNVSNGVEYSSSTAASSGYIPIKNGETYYLSGLFSTLRSIVFFYDLSKTYLRRTSGEERSGLLIGSEYTNGAGYLRVIQYDNAGVTTIDEDITGIQLELGSVAHGYVPYGYVGLEVASPQSLYRDNYSIIADGTLTPAPNNENWHVLSFPLAQQNFKFCYVIPSTLTANTRIHAYDSNGTWICQVTFAYNQDSGSKTIECVAPSNATEIRVSIRKEFTDTRLLYSTTPIPLPSRGWVASLPDGTADTLTLDGAGKVVWEEKTDEFVYDGSSDEVWYKHPSTNRLLTVEDKLPVPKTNGYPAIATHYRDFMAGWDRLSNGEFFISNDSLSRGVKYVVIHDDVRSADVSTWTTWLQSNPITILYPLATPVTESRGYIDLPEIPEGVTLSCPELDALNVKYCVDDSASTLARQYYNRAKSEYEDRIASLEEAVAEIIAGA